MTDKAEPDPKKPINIPQRKLCLGKIDYRHSGVKNCSVEIEWEIKDGVFSMSGTIWNPKHTDCYSGGQNIDEIAELFANDAKVQRMHAIWKRWHLNDLRAGCEHQRAMGWGKDTLVLVTFKLQQDVFRKQSMLKERAFEELLEGKSVQLTSDEIHILKLPYEVVGPGEAGAPYEMWRDATISDGYVASETEHKSASWVRPTEHPDGVLCKPCPTCGYKFGSKWIREELPDEVVEEIASW